MKLSTYMFLKIKNMGLWILLGLGNPICAEYYAPAQSAKTHLWGYINQDGKRVTPFRYKLAFNFSCDKAIVLRDNKWCFLDKKNLTENCVDSFLQGYFSNLAEALLGPAKRHY